MNALCSFPAILRWVVRLVYSLSLACTKVFEVSRLCMADFYNWMIRPTERTDRFDGLTIWDLVLVLRTDW